MARKLWGGLRTVLLVMGFAVLLLIDLMCCEGFPRPRLKRPCVDILLSAVESLPPIRESREWAGFPTFAEDLTKLMQERTDIVEDHIQWMESVNEITKAAPRRAAPYVEKGLSEFRERWSELGHKLRKLTPPPAAAEAHDLFALSVQKEMQAIEYIQEWRRTGEDELWVKAEDANREANRIWRMCADEMLDLMTEYEER